MIDRVERYEQMAQTAAKCESCDLYKGRKNVVFHRGPVPAELLVCGEGPGRQEDLSGAPFIGPAGKKLDELLGKAGVDNGAVHVTNIVKCRPRDDHAPSRGDVEACTDRWLFDQVRLVDPLVILALGSTASRFLLGRPVGEARKMSNGRWSDIAVVATFHPAHLLYTAAEGNGIDEVEAMKDFSMLNIVLERERRIRRPMMDTGSSMR